MHNELNFSESEELYFMRAALDESINAKNKTEVPVGAVIVNADGNVIATAHNLVESELDATSHAECLVLSKAMRRLVQKDLEKCDLCFFFFKQKTAYEIVM